jgi:hypothetical protein
VVCLHDQQGFADGRSPLHRGMRLSGTLERERLPDQRAQPTSYRLGERGLDELALLAGRGPAAADQYDVPSRGFLIADLREAAARHAEWAEPAAGS